MLGLVSDDERINLSANAEPEFDQWRWVDYWQPVHEVVSFKKSVYQRALTELESAMTRYWMTPP
jgi:putative (di)nucleoside polyphosphate hydrolase